MISMAIVKLVIDGRELNFRIKNINGIGFYDRLTRARHDINIYLSLVVVEPQLSATEWYENVPIIYKEKIVQAIENYVEEQYVQPL